MLVLTVLLAVALPALAMNKGQARIASSVRENLRQFALAWQIYGQENNNLLPSQCRRRSWALGHVFAHWRRADADRPDPQPML